MMMRQLLRHTNRQMSFLGMTTATQRTLITPEGKPYVVPESLKDVVSHLDAKRPKFTLLYFSAAWNPKCAEIEQDYLNLCYKFGHWHHIRVDCDAAPSVKRYFDARIEP